LAFQGKVLILIIIMGIGLILGLSPEEPRRARKLNRIYLIGTTEIQISLYSHKQANQNFWTFAWDLDNENYHYTNIPGSYAWHPETNELKHITYIGTAGESAWVIFTDDFKYIIEDFGTSPGPRGLGIWQANNGKRIFSGSYYRDIKLHGHVVEVIYSYVSWAPLETKSLRSYFYLFCKLH
jgi:hypothetical protein